MRAELYGLDEQSRKGKKWDPRLRRDDALPLTRHPCEGGDPISRTIERTQSSFSRQADDLAMDSYVYILASETYGTLYVGVTSNLLQRMHQHRAGTYGGFTAQYQVKKLVWYEIHCEITEAILREKQIKHWPRAWKVRMIQAMNPAWRDLFEDIC